MRELRIVVCALAVALTGCDAWYVRRIDVTSGSGSQAQAYAERIASAVSEYAKRMNLECEVTELSIIDCFRQPMHVFAFYTDQGAAVCFYSMGAQFEAGKFRKHMSELTTLVETRLSPASVEAYEPTDHAACTAPALPSGYKARQKPGS